MERTEIHYRIQTAILVLILFTFPFRPLILNNLCVILLGVSWLAQGKLRSKVRTLANSRIALLYGALYLILLISFLFSDDKREGAKILERNLFILCVPIILATSKISRGQVIKAMYGFVAGCIFATLLSLAYACYRYSLAPMTHYFFYHDLSMPLLKLHAVYFSLYIAVCILFLVLELERRWLWQSRGRNFLYLLALVILSTGIILLSSKTIIITLTLLLNLLFIRWIIKKKKRMVGVVAIGLLNLSIIIGIIKIDYVKARFMDSLNYNIQFVKKDTYSELTVFTGVTVRLTFWKFVIEILTEHDSLWTGMTIGDGDHALHQKAVEKNLYGGNKEMGWTDYTSYNAHNQYFQYLLWIGVPGLAYFIFVQAAILWHAAKFRKVLLALCMLLFIAFCMTESVLAVHKGIMFFAIIPPLLVYTNVSLRSTPEKAQQQGNEP